MMVRMRIPAIVCASFVIGAIPGLAQTDYDLVVYGGTAGGVITAVAPAREGLHVILLEPGRHLGGMATGLSRTDFGKKKSSAGTQRSSTSGLAPNTIWRASGSLHGSERAHRIGDRKVQACNFRMILTDVPSNRLAFPKPPNYDPHRYELLSLLLAANTKKLGRSPIVREVSLIARIPNGKADFNNNGPFSTDYIGKSWDYPQASYARRKEIWDDHINCTKGFFYFLAHDPSVKKELRRRRTSGVCQKMNTPMRTSGLTSSTSAKLER